VSHTHGADSEVGTLRSVLLHRPGLELKRITPSSRSGLLLHGQPWVGRAQEEHDLLAAVLREHDVEVLYLTELLQDVLEYQPARDEAIAGVLACTRPGDQLGSQIRSHLSGLDPEALAQVLIAGLPPAELRSGSGVVFELLGRHEFVIDPLPNLMFSRDSSSWIGDRAAVASMADPGRRREPALMGVIYSHHPRFAGGKYLYGPDLEPAEGGDVLLLAPGVLAVGISDATTPAGLERLAREVLDAGLVHTVLAVPLRQHLPGAHLDTVCTLVDTDAVVMYPGLAFTLTAHAITAHGDGLRMSRPRPFLEAAASAMGIDRLQVIGTGLDPVTGPGEQWDDGGNALAIGRRLVVCQERNTETNARLEAAGIEVIRVPSGELGSGRGGPRCLCCPVARDPAPGPDLGPDLGPAPARPGRPVTIAGSAACRSAAETAHDLVLDEPILAEPVIAGAPAAWLPVLTTSS
jgi:arginine deiminase